MTIDMTFATAREAPGRLVAVSGTREGATTVTGVPANLGPRTMAKLGRVVFWPVPRTLTFDRLMSYRDGQVVRDA
jgi:hypothetical protein